MDENTPTNDASRQHGVSPRRRRLLTALGAACLPAVAGCTGSSPTQSTTTTTTTATETMQQTTTTTRQQDTRIDSRFGFSGTSDDSPPVTPDYTVNLLIKPRKNVPIPEFYFEPTGLKIDVGDTIRFNLATPHHNVNAYHPGFGYTQRVPDDVPPFSAPILTQGDYWLYTFDTEGVYDIMCAPHEVFGMVGRIVVGSASGPGSNPVGEAPGGEQARPPEFTAALVLSSSPMQPSTIAEKGSVSWKDIPAESKRPMLKPVKEE